MRQIKSLTGLDATQDENNFIILCGKVFIYQMLFAFNGWIYAERKDVISALESNFVDIDNYFRSCGFYYGTDDNGHSYSASQYKAKSMWLLSKQLNITNRIRVNDTSGGNYFNLTTSTKILKKQSNQFLENQPAISGNSNRKQYCKIIYRRQAIYPKRTPVIKQHKSFINGKPYAISTLQTSFNSSTYYDKTKLLSAVKILHLQYQSQKLKLYLTTEKIMLTLQETKQNYIYYVLP